MDRPRHQNDAPPPPGKALSLGASRQLRVHRLVPVGSLDADLSRNGSRRCRRRMDGSVRPSPRPRHLPNIAAAWSSLPRQPSYSWPGHAPSILYFRSKAKEDPPRFKTKAAPAQSKAKEALPRSKAKEAPPRSRAKEALPRSKDKEVPPRSKAMEAPPRSKATEAPPSNKETPTKIRRQRGLSQD
ncbi:hypothetical protein NDU88_007597 [Pleurodeles waltl]|uniref:Uncharacterized protein n=1 Tax=Pleurodeles waltl TaxID=8319 RepID=A0AAV7VU51_PLEWA|nr:hypothetical protein NDU88_007597 [Pleurodeles waltl]